MILIYLSVFAYCLGAFNTSYYLMKLLKKQDIRTMNSGNAGATNVGRSLGAKGFLVVFSIDACKGALLIVLVNYFNVQIYSVIVLLMGVIGHCFPLQLKGVGGKGVSLAYGGSLLLNPVLTLGLTIVVLSGSYFTKRKNIFAMSAFTLFYVLHGFNSTDATLSLGNYLLPALLIYNHRKNLYREFFQ